MKVNNLLICTMCVGLWMLLNTHSWAQSYPADREKFVKELQRLTATTAPEEDMLVMKKELYASIVTLKTVPDAYFTKMVETVNSMETKKLRHYPEIYNYVFSVYSFVKNKQTQESYTAWHGSLDKLLGLKNLNKAKDFIEFSSVFFSENVLAASNNFKWRYDGGSYTFHYADEKPSIIFKGGNLGCYLDNRSKNPATYKVIDSVFIQTCDGTFNPIEKEWKGKGGKVTWERVGLDKNKTFADLRSYQINMKIGNFRVDTASLTTPYFTKPLLGQLNERVYNINRQEDKIYPQFSSFEKSLKIKNLFENVDYTGGYTLKGATVVGVGTEKVPARVQFLRDGKVMTNITSQTIIFNQKEITALAASASIRLGEKDSIYHPSLKFSYDNESSKYELTRDKTGLASSPFISTYHNLEIYAPKITWTKKDNFIDLTYGIEIGEDSRIMRLDSRNYFDARLYEKLQGMEAVHPLVALYKFCYKYDEFNIDEGKFATALNKTLEQAKPILLEVSANGFVDYNPETKSVVVNDKTKNFIDARSGKMDYDNLSFLSDLRIKKIGDEYSPDKLQRDENLRKQYEYLRKSNDQRKLLKSFGKIDLASLEIQLVAVDRVEIANSSSTAVFPESGQVTIKKDRNFEFSGWVNSGKFEVKSVKANYDYALNKINLIQTTTGYFNVTPFSANDGNKPIPMQSTLSGLVGEIKVEDVKNRSGNNKAIVGYPKLLVTKEAKVFYNNEAIHKGAYDSTRFYYTVLPFEMDSLTAFSDKAFRLSGSLTSAGIFPKFQEELKIMPDYSLGFSKIAPVEGYDFYANKAKYNNKIVLSNNGLQGSGKIDFMQSTSESAKFTFLPDSTIGLAKFVNKPIETGIQFPDVTSDKAYIVYHPKGGKLVARSTDVPLVYFNKEATLKGELTITNEGMTGVGTISFKAGAELQAGDFKFKRWDVHSDLSRFAMKNSYQEPGEENLAFKTTDLTSDVSLKDRKGVFKSNKGESKIEFPLNQYYCKMDIFSWFMDGEAIDMELNVKDKTKIDIDGSGIELTKSNFYSTNPTQDTLQFRSAKASFNMKEKTIYCDKVLFIQVADARIFPDQMKVFIRKKAEMDELKNSTILANYVTKYHQFFDANTKITGRYAYTSVGKYNYIDADSVVTVIPLSSITLDAQKQTVALGKIENTSTIKLNKQFDFYGGLQINAANPLITFNGATRLNHNCETFPKNWMAFKSEINPKNIQIPVSSTMKTLEGIPVSAGIVWRNSRVADSVRLYPTFLSMLEDANDPIVITADGFLQYDFKLKEFQIGSKEKLANRNEKGNFISLHTESCSLNGDGKINLGMDFGDVTVDAIGVVNYNQSTQKTDLNITARYNFPVMDKNAFEKAALKIVDNSSLRPLDINSSTLLQAITEWKDVKTADAIKNEFVQKGEVKKLPKELSESIVITGLRLSSYNNSSTQVNGLISSTEFASVVSIYDRVIFKQLPVKAFFKQVYSENPAGDKFNLYFNNPGGADFFFDYTVSKKDGLLQIYTNDSELESTMTVSKDDKRKAKNFKYEITPNSGLLSIFMGLFE